jgi:uncharacterized protein YndB with AHSA1/START domain
MTDRSSTDHSSTDHSSTTASTAAVTRSVVVERELPYPPEKIWRALTEGALLKQWLMDNDFQPGVGHRFNFRAAPVPNWNGVIECEVQVVEPNKKLAYSWGTMGMVSVVTWTLTSTGAGTHLRMEQSGFGPDQEANYKGAKYGWNKFIGRMEGVLAGLQ